MDNSHGGTSSKINEHLIVEMERLVTTRNLIVEATFMKSERREYKYKFYLDFTSELMVHVLRF